LGPIPNPQSPIPNIYDRIKINNTDQYYYT
jgi:hypothetical protein